MSATEVGLVAGRLRSQVRGPVLGPLAGLLLGLLLGTGLWLLGTFTAEERAALPGLLRSGLRGSLRPPSRTSVEAGVTAEGRGAEAHPRDPWTAAVHRPANFVAWQFAVRALLGAGLGLLLGALVSGSGAGEGDAPKRGPRLRDWPKETVSARRRAQAFVVIVACGLAAVPWIANGRFVVFDDALAATLAARSSFWSEWLAPQGHVGLVWIDDGLPRGFHHAEEARAELERTVLFGSVAGALTQACGLSALGLFALGLRARRQIARDARVRLATVPIAQSKEVYHLLVCGSPGAGKSSAIKDVLDQVRARGARAIVYDASGEYTARYFRPGRDFLLNPLDPRSAPWTPWAEARTPEAYAALARALFPPGGPEPFWADASATLFSSALEALDRADKRSNEALRHALTAAKLEDLHEFLQGTPAARFLDPKAGAMPANLIATVTSRLEAWSVLSDPPDDVAPFSVRAFCSDAKEDAWLFLASTPREAAILRPLLSLWADVAASALLSQPIAHGAASCWVVLDEVASLQRLPALPGLLERGRKHGVAVVLGLQAMPQLREAYGHDGAAALLAQPQTWLVLRSVEPDTARWLEAALGHVEVEAINTSVAMGKGTPVSVQAHAAMRPLVLASEIATLADFEGFLRVAGEGDVLRVQVPKLHERKGR